MADGPLVLISLRINDVLYQPSPLNKMLIPKIIDGTFLSCELLYNFAVSYARRKKKKHIKVKKETRNRK